METSVLKKRLNMFNSSKGTLRQVNDEVLMDVLRAWENWRGSRRSRQESRRGVHALCCKAALKPLYSNDPGVGTTIA